MNGARVAARHPGRWAGIGGPVLTLALVALHELLASTPLRIPNPPAFLVLAIVFSAFRGGLGPGLISAAVAWAYIAYFFSQPDQAFQYTDDNLRRVIVWAFVMPLMAYIVGLLHRRAARALIEEARRESQRASEIRFRTVVTTMTEGLVVTDSNGVIEFANDVFCRMLGWSRAEIEGHRAREFAATSEDATLMDRRRLLRPVEGANRYETSFRTKGGAIRHAVVSEGPFLNAAGDVVGGIGVIADVTEQRELEARLRQAQKMEAVGRLAGGVAHDFNNILTAILGYSDLLLGASDPISGWRDDVAQIQTSGRRAADLTKQLLAFSRQQIIQPRILDVNRVTLGVQPMLRRLIREDVEFVVALDPTAGCVLADPGQMEQILINLAVNARDAMPHGGRITFRTAAVAMDVAATAERSFVARGSYVLMSVSDTGVGMDEATKAHIFEPFFTTKEVGKGTGLGLATVFGIVKQADGYVWVDSAPGRGATIEVYLPRIEGEPASDREVQPEARPRGGGETILLVEDDDGVRTVAQEILAQHGYVVIPAEGPEAAIAEAARLGSRIDLVMTDLVMPGMSGRELAERLKSTRTELKVLYMSGYAGETIVRHGVLDSEAAYLPKPFDVGELLGKVREALSAEHPSWGGQASARAAPRA